MRFHPLRWIGRRVRTALGYYASRTIHKPFKIGVSDLKKASYVGGAWYVGLTGLFPIITGLLNMLSDHADEITKYFGDTNKVKSFVAFIVFVHKLSTLYIQGPTISVDPTDPTIPSSIPKDEPPK